MFLNPYQHNKLPLVEVQNPTTTDNMKNIELSRPSENIQKSALGFMTKTSRKTEMTGSLRMKLDTNFFPYEMLVKNSRRI